MGVPAANAVTTDADVDHRISDPVGRDFTAAAPGQKLASNIAYIRTAWIPGGRRVWHVAREASSRIACGSNIASSITGRVSLSRSSPSQRHAAGPGAVAVEYVAIHSPGAPRMGTGATRFDEQAANLRNRNRS